MLASDARPRREVRQTDVRRHRNPPHAVEGPNTAWAAGRRGPPCTGTGTSGGGRRRNRLGPSRIGCPETGAKQPFPRDRSDPGGDRPVVQLGDGAPVAGDDLRHEGRGVAPAGRTGASWSDRPDPAFSGGRPRPAESRCRPLRRGAGFDGCRRRMRSRPVPWRNARRRRGTVSIGSRGLAAPGPYGVRTASPRRSRRARGPAGGSPIPHPPAARDVVAGSG